MAPCNASTGRGTAAATTSSSSQASTSKTVDPLMELNLLQHINGIRQVPNFVAFDIFSQSIGPDWMDGMLAQAKDIRRQWCTEYIASGRDQRDTHVARIAGEMLKSPSRRRAANARTQSRTASRKVPKESSSTPFKDAENKENASISARKATGSSVQAADASSHSLGAARGTRSRADKGQIVRLPNPFQAKLVQTKAAPAPSNVETSPPSADEQAGNEERQMAPTRSQPQPQTKGKEKQKAPAKLTKKQQAEQKKKATASSAMPTTTDEDTVQVLPAKTQSKTKGRAKPKQNEPKSDVDPPGAATTEMVPPASDMLPLEQFDESMEVDATLANNLLTEQPQASTPTGKKASSKMLEKRMVEEGLAPIADEALSDDENSSLEEEGGMPPGKAATKTVELTQSARDENTGSIVSASTSDNLSGGGAAVTTAAPTPAPPPKQKRTLASFGGSKKSLGYGLQSQPSSTPANAGFKSSFLNKSLRKAHTLNSSGGDDAEDDDEEANEDDSMIGTKANTQANAAAMLGVKKDASSSMKAISKAVDGKLNTEKSTLSAISSRLAGSKRNSEEMEEVEDEAAQTQTATRGPAPKLARTLSDRSEKTAAQDSGRVKADTVTASKTHASKLPTTSNLLRTKLESARLQKSTNTGAVGLGAKGLSSPILGRAALISQNEKSEAESATSTRGDAFSMPTNVPAVGSRSSGSNVASLLDQWEAKSQPTRTSPRKSMTLRNKSPSKIPPPTSTTPLNSPVKALRKPAPQNAAKAAAAPTLLVGQTKVKPTRADETKAVEAELDIILAKTEIVPAGESGKSSYISDEDDETSTLNDEDGEADDESEYKDRESKTTTNVMRPLSAAAQSTQTKDRATESDGTSTQGTRSGSYFSGNDNSADSDADDDKFSLEELEGRKTMATSTASSSAAPTVKNIPAGLNGATTNSSKAIEGNAGSSQWGHKLKSLFNISGAGLPGVIGASGPVPGTGFQPKTSRTLSGSVSAQKDIHGAVTPREPQAASALGTSTFNGGGMKPASVVRADQLRRKEAEETERRTKEQEEKRKQLMASKASTQKAKADEDREKEKKKRSREGEERIAKKADTASSMQQRTGPHPGGVGGTLGQPSKARLMSQFGGTAANGGPAPIAKLKGSVHTTNANGGGSGLPVDDTGKKRRLSKEREEGVPQRLQPAPTANGLPKGMPGPSSIRIVGNGASGTQNGAPRLVKPATNGPARPQQQQQNQHTGLFRPPIAHQNSNFSQQNPFQQSQRPGGAGPSQLPSRSGMSAPQQQHRAQPVPPSPAACVDDDDVSLPSIVSEYSDSEDEATQARRARAAPWTKGDALQRALRDQEAVDADLIFGIPQGTVDLEALMPAESAAAKARLGRPRTSSANWSGADGLAQWEIDRYNERMNIIGPGYRLPAKTGGSGTAAPNGRLGPNGQEHRRSVLAIGAAAAARQQQQNQANYRP